MKPSVGGAVILSGGKGARLGGRSKAHITLEGGTLLEEVAGQLRLYTDRIVLVARQDLQDEADRLGLIRTMEEPAGGGPAAGIQAGIEALAALGCGEGGRDVALFAIDTPGVALLLPLLLAERERFPHADGVLPLVAFPQYLQGLYAFDALRKAFPPSVNAHGRSVKSFMKQLDLHTFAVGVDVSRDLDTPEDLSFWHGY